MRSVSMATCKWEGHSREDKPVRDVLPGEFFTLVTSIAPRVVFMRLHPELYGTSSGRPISVANLITGVVVANIGKVDDYDVGRVHEFVGDQVVSMLVVDMKAWYATADSR